MSSPQNPAEKANEPDYLILSHNIELLNANSKRNERACKLKETSSDTFDLCEDNTFNFKELKRKYINNLISWSFIKKISDLLKVRTFGPKYIIPLLKLCKEFNINIINDIKEEK